MESREVDLGKGAVEVLALERSNLELLVGGLARAVGALTQLLAIVWENHRRDIDLQRRYRHPMESHHGPRSSR